MVIYDNVDARKPKSIWSILLHKPLCWFKLHDWSWSISYWNRPITRTSRVLIYDECRYCGAMRHRGDFDVEHLVNIKQHEIIEGEQVVE